MKNVSTYPNVRFFEDTTRKMDIEAVREQDFKTGHANKGGSGSAWWIRIEAESPANEPVEWVLKFNYGQFDELQSWQFNDKGRLVSHVLKGDHFTNASEIPFAQRSAFEFVTLPGAKDTIYVKLSYADFGIMEMFHSVWTKNEFVKSQEFRFNLLVGIASALSVLLFYNLFIWVILRKKEYFWYNVYIVGVIFSLLTFNQLGAHYLWDRSLYLIDMMPVISVVILFVSFILFTRAFLETAELLPKVDRVLKILVVLNISALVLANFGERHLAVGLIQLVSLFFIFFPVIGFMLWRRGYKIARGYTLASLVLSLTFVLSLFRYLDILQSSELLFWIVRFGFIAEGIILSIALADRITILENDTIRAQNNLYLTLEEAKNTLVSEVRKRTLELEIQTKKAEELARVDEMTGLWNRRAFLERGEDFIHYGTRYKTPFSLVLIDLDLFKNINDRYGHEAGDLTLKVFAKEISANIRDTDFFARVGGEEFVVLLSHASAQAAMEKTKILLRKINEMEIFYKESVLKITASMGVCEFSYQEETIYSMLAKADEALYYVKEHGRNNVHLYSAS